jgi:hypothetical protein
MISHTNIGPDVVSYLNKLPNDMFDDKQRLVSHLRIYGRLDVAKEIETMSQNEYEDFVCNAL